MEGKTASISLNPRSDVPFFEQIASQLRIKILSGQLEIGNQLPTVRQLAQQLRINFNTVARAYRLLEAEGLTSTQQGRGTFILKQETLRAHEETRQKDLEALVQRIAGLIVSSGFTAQEVAERLSPTPVLTPSHQEKARKRRAKKRTRLAGRDCSSRVDWMLRNKPGKKQKKRV